MLAKNIDPISALPIINVQVCILTFRRPAQLRAALESVLTQTLRDPAILKKIEREHGRHVSMHVLVIDNDAAETGRSTVLAAPTDHTSSIRYVCEPRRGLSAARNRALSESSEMDYIAFLDDDETASITWLEHLLRCCWLYDADVVTGPVDPEYGGSPAWVCRGNFFKAVNHSTGKRLTCAASNNTLIVRSVIANFRFDPRFDATGGEDTDFFLRLSRSGLRIIWSDEARVTEAVPPVRANLRWILRRAWSDANRYTLARCSLDADQKTSARRLIVGCGGFTIGVLLLPTAIFGRQYGARALQLIARAMGTFSALRGKTHGYYATTSHG